MQWRANRLKLSAIKFPAQAHSGRTASAGLSGPQTRSRFPSEHFLTLVSSARSAVGGWHFQSPCGAEQPTSLITLRCSQAKPSNCRSVTYAASSRCDLQPLTRVDQTVFCLPLVAV